MTDWDHLTEPQQIALTFVASVEGKRVCEVRRDALRAYAEEALADTDMAAAVRHCLKHRREEGVGGHEVVQLRSVR